MHAVGPEWKGGDDKEDELLGKCITNILREAEKKKAKSIAIPAISTGTYGYPIRKATDVIVTAIKDYNSNTIDEILLVDIREEAVNSFCHALSEAFHQDVPIPVIAGRRRDYEPDRPTLSVYAATENDMKAAIADIKTMVHEECMKEHVNSDRDKNAIANLDAVQVFFPIVTMFCEMLVYLSSSWMEFLSYNDGMTCRSIPKMLTPRESQLKD